MPRPKIYHHLEELGSGYFGDVVLVRSTPPSRNWEKAAMKIIQNPGEDADQEVDILKDNSIQT